MQRIIRLPIAVGDTLTFYFQNGRKPEHLLLRSLKVVDNRIEWLFRSSQNHSLFGTGARHSEKFPHRFLSNDGNDDSWICLSIPIVMHVAPGELRTNFILNVPSSVRVQKNEQSAKAIEFSA